MKNFSHPITLVLIKKVLYFLVIVTSCSTLEAQNKFDQYNDYLNLKNTDYTLFLHNKNFLVPLSYNATPHEDTYSILPGYNDHKSRFYENLEAEFQVSFFFPIYRNIFKNDWDILFAYTQHSWWQIYNSAWSKPFRETNNTPEIFFRKINMTDSHLFNLHLYSVDLGYIHQSNGQIQILSRSWDRVFARALFNHEDFSLKLMAWYRMPERLDSDDNPHIADYLGWGSVELHQSVGSHSIELIFPIANNPGVEMQYSYPWHEHLRWFVSLRSGYGQSLIEYNHETQRIGLGITLETVSDKNQHH